MMFNVFLWCSLNIVRCDFFCLVRRCLLQWTIWKYFSLALQVYDRNLSLQCRPQGETNTIHSGFSGCFTTIKVMEVLKEKLNDGSDFDGVHLLAHRTSYLCKTVSLTLTILLSPSRKQLDDKKERKILSERVFRIFQYSSVIQLNLVRS